jgi:hypothetical protein
LSALPHFLNSKPTKTSVPGELNLESKAGRKQIEASRISVQVFADPVLAAAKHYSPSVAEACSGIWLTRRIADVDWDAIRNPSPIEVRRDCMAAPS